MVMGLVWERSYREGVALHESVHDLVLLPRDGHAEHLELVLDLLRLERVHPRADGVGVVGDVEEPQFFCDLRVFPDVVHGLARRRLGGVDVTYTRVTGTYGRGAGAWERRDGRNGPRGRRAFIATTPRRRRRRDARRSGRDGSHRRQRCHVELYAWIEGIRYPRSTLDGYPRACVRGCDAQRSPGIANALFPSAFRRNSEYSGRAWKLAPGTRRHKPNPSQTTESGSRLSTVGREPFNTPFGIAISL